MATAVSEPGIYQRDLTAAAGPRYLRPELLMPMMARPGRSIEIIRDFAELQALKEEWQALERRCTSPVCAFQSYDWCETWARLFIAEKQLARLFVVTFRRDGHLLLVWPLMITGTTFKVLRWLSDPYAQYGDVLIDASADQENCLEKTWDHIRSRSGVDVIRLRHVPEQSASAGFLREHLLEANSARQQAPFLDLSVYKTEAAYDARYSKVQRRRRRKIRNALERRGVIEFGPGEIAEEFGRMIAEKRLWMRRHGYQSHVLSSPDLCRFMIGLANRPANSLQPVLSAMKLDGETISWELGFRYKDRHLAYLTAHDHRYHLMSTARLHMDQTQRLALQQGVRTFDLMVPADPHKASFQSGYQDVFCFYAPFTLKGWIYGKLYLSLVWPMARRAYHALPDRLRKWITGLGVSKAT